MSNIKYHCLECWHYPVCRITTQKIDEFLKREDYNLDAFYSELAFNCDCYHPIDKKLFRRFEHYEHPLD